MIAKKQRAGIRSLPKEVPLGSVMLLTRDREGAVFLRQGIARVRQAENNTIIYHA